MLSSWRNRTFENDMLNLVNDDSKSIQPYYIPRARSSTLLSKSGKTGQEKRGFLADLKQQQHSIVSECLCLRNFWWFDIIKHDKVYFIRSLENNRNRFWNDWIFRLGLVNIFFLIPISKLCHLIRKEIIWYKRPTAISSHHLLSFKL